MAVVNHWAGREYSDVYLGKPLLARGEPFQARAIACIRSMMSSA